MSELLKAGCIGVIYWSSNGVIKGLPGVETIAHVVCVPFRCEDLVLGGRCPSLRGVPFQYPGL